MAHTSPKNILSLPLLIAAIAFVFTACDDSSTGPGTGEEESQLETHTVADLPANPNNTGDITYFSLRENSVVEASDSASTQWDLAFFGTTIYTNSGSSGPGNGGAVVLDQSFEETTMAPSSAEFNIDTDSLLAIPNGTDNGWYHYDFSTHIVTPIDNTTLVVRTADGASYAKIHIMSYYKGNPDVTSDEFNNNTDQYPSRYYTFEYAIQLNGSRELQ